MKAIETKYKGYRFRSRLEARWAVFFDAIGFDWQYEVEGYHLPNGKMYLPDFYLPKFNCWIEIKGGEPSDSELDACRSLFYGKFGDAVASDAMLTFNTNIMMDFATKFEKSGYGKGGNFIKEATHKWGKVYLFYGLLDKGYLTLPGFSVEVFAKNIFETFLFFQEGKWQVKVDLPKKYHPKDILPACLEKARQARFEHGEHGL